MKDTNKGNRWLWAEKRFLVLRTRSKYMKCAKSCLKIKTVNSVLKWAKDMNWQFTDRGN